MEGLRGFLQGFDNADPDLQFEKYLEDPNILSDADALVKFAGQVCYLSLGPKRSMNVDVKKYMDNILSSGHGSVTEHVYFTFIYGLGRDFTHEIVRHRAGYGFSQVSQRYVDGSVLRFAERPEFQADFVLHQAFERRIDNAAADYDYLAKSLIASPAMQAKLEKLPNARDKRKAVNQAARACLPNEVEAPIVVTANVRGLRHGADMRAAAPADLPIRDAFVKIDRMLRLLAPALFHDHEDETLPDGTTAVKSKYRKV